MQHTDIKENYLCPYLTRKQLVEQFPTNTYEGWRRVPTDVLPYSVRGKKAIYKREDIIRYLDSGFGKPKRGRPRTERVILSALRGIKEIIMMNANFHPDEIRIVKVRTNLDAQVRGWPTKAIHQCQLKWIRGLGEQYGLNIEIVEYGATTVEQMATKALMKNINQHVL